MRERELISIIIPAYNSEKTILRCLKSITEQTYTNIEIIIVDDGSTDSTINICTKNTDKRIKIIREENSGPAYARNTGLSSSSGEWVMFVDSDDYIDPCICERLLTSVKENNADMGFCNLINYSLEGQSKILKPFFGEERVFEGCELEKIKYFLIENESETGDAPLCLSGPVCKLLKKSKCELIRFPSDISYGEDVCFVLPYLELSEKIVYINDVLYYRIIQPNSVSYVGITGNRLSKYTNWIIDNYYNNSLFKNAVNTLISKHTVWIMSICFHRASLRTLSDSVKKIEHYNNQLHHRITIKEILKSEINKGKKAILILARFNLYVPIYIWYKINK